MCGLYYVEAWSFYAYILNFFIINECWILSTDFSESIEMILGIIFQFVNIVYHFDQFGYVEESLHFQTKPTWSWYMILLICC